MHPTLQEYMHSITLQKYQYIDDDSVHVWYIYGTSSNPDWNGAHYNTELKANKERLLVKGTYRQAYEYALRCKDFSMWRDADGTIEKVEVINLF